MLVRKRLRITGRVQGVAFRNPDGHYGAGAGSRRLGN